jgi:N-acyl amino acid synthase of PEP-CTERM/exosortase system
MGALKATGPIVWAKTNREESLLDRFDRDYDCRLANDPMLLQRALETRYQVYCVENAFENAHDNRSGIETDEFDFCSRHSVLIYRPTGETIGTVRLILPVNGKLDSFSMRGIASLCKNKLPVPLASTAEVSRFSVSKRSRQEALSSAQANRSLSQMAHAMRRTEPLPSLGLIQGLVRMSMLHGISHWCAVMEPKMLRMLAAMGIHFEPVGDLVEHHGLRQLCYCEIASVLETVKQERPSFWEIISAGGALRAVLSD